jgi:hypothetical protein
MNLQLNDPTLPPPGEIVSEEQPASYRTASPQPMTGSPVNIMSGDPHHFRTPSLGEIHQELEQEQEAQVVGCFYLHSSNSLRRWISPFWLCYVCVESLRVSHIMLMYQEYLGRLY